MLFLFFTLFGQGWGWLSLGRAGAGSPWAAFSGVSSRVFAGLFESWLAWRALPPSGGHPTKKCKKQKKQKNFMKKHKKS